MNEAKQKRIEELDKAIADLREHMVMWGRAGGVGGRMAMQAYGQLQELELEREDLVNGTNKLAISRKEREIARLRALKEDAILLKKLRYKKELEKEEKALQELKKK